jgi:hypothetical protein
MMLTQSDKSTRPIPLQEQFDLVQLLDSQTLYPALFPPVHFVQHIDIPNGLLAHPFLVPGRVLGFGKGELIVKPGGKDDDIYILQCRAVLEMDDPAFDLFDQRSMLDKPCPRLTFLFFLSVRRHVVRQHRRRLEHLDFTLGGDVRVGQVITFPGELHALRKIGGGDLDRGKFAGNI